MRLPPGSRCRPRWRMDSIAEDIAAAEAALAHAPAEAEARATFLYRHWFHDAPIGDETGAPVVWPTRAEYRAAALPSAPLETGWRVTGPGSDSRLRISHTDGREAEASLLDIVLENPLTVPVPGATLRRRRWIERDVGGFWHLWSENWAQDPPKRMVRLYLPIAPAAMLTAAAHLVAHLPPETMWAMKFLSGPHISGRRDAGLIYLAQGRLESLAPDPLLTGLAPFLTGPSPRLTRPWHGGCVADDPGDGRSFGEAVSQALAGIAPGPRFAARAAEALAPLLGHLKA
jgi:hypothetical protein